jgi:hypothetical protein
MGKTKDQPFTWEYSTTVEALHAADLNIVEFGAFGLFNGNWGFSNAGGQPFSTRQFAEWYSCTDGILKPGKPVTDPKNWNRGKILRSTRSKAKLPVFFVFLCWTCDLHKISATR